MADREKVLSGLEHCRRGPIGCQQECPYKSDFGCRSQLTADALELLKKQEPVEPKLIGVNTWTCGECGALLGWEDFTQSGLELVECKYCPGCGRKVKWDEGKRNNR